MWRHLGLLLAALQMVQTAFGFWAVDCGIVAKERFDPIASPGDISDHVHVVAGSSNFGPNATTGEFLRQGECTSCDVAQDKSAYWAPQMYMAPAETAGKDEGLILQAGGVPVPTMDGNAFVIYYKLITDRGERTNNNEGEWEKIIEFPDDFQMLVSERFILSKIEASESLFDRPLTYKCLGHGEQMDMACPPSDPSLCVSGLRAQLTLPSCWDGVNADSIDHISHMAYPVGSWAGSPCPTSHPVRVPTLFAEIIYDPRGLGQYAAQGWRLVFPFSSDQFTNVSEPLFHLGFKNGWEQNFLRTAINECGATPCVLVQKYFSMCNKGGEEADVSLPVTELKQCKRPERRNKKWKLLWKDEFNKWNKNKWWHLEGDGCEYGICTWGNGELQYYSNSTRNSYVEGGSLFIEPRYETGQDLEQFKQYCRSRCSGESSCLGRCEGIQFSSARLSTRGKFDIKPSSSDHSLIKIETRFRVSEGAGLWPAIWMLPTDFKYGKWAASGEIDLFESSNDMRIAHATIHYGGSWPENTFYGKKASFAPNKWHRVAFYWDPVSMRWRLNGREIFRAKTGCGERTGWFSIPENRAISGPNAPFDQDFHLLVNVAVGGMFTGNIPGPMAAADLQKESKKFEIDYIRVYGM
eukprot:jgi/Picsp_1/3251/NSC_06091-R1_glucan endo- -beta-d-glucosidase